MDISGWTAGLFIPNRRTIGGIHAQVTISEQESDELQITEHPVEQGAPISDHAFKRPSEVHIRAGWSRGDLGATSGTGMYALLLQWQAALRPFDLHTGKRAYKDMLIQRLTVTTDSHSEFALMADIVCKQVIIVSASVGETSKLNSQDPQNQSDPASNATSVDNGPQQGRDVSSGDTNTSDLDEQQDFGGGQAVGSEDADIMGGEGRGPGPEPMKVETVTARNDPVGEIRAEKGVLTPLRPGQTLDVAIPPP